MSSDEIKELMALKDWRMAHLAIALDVGENAVYKWVHEINNPLEKYASKMRRWLAEARQANGKKAVAK